MARDKDWNRPAEELFFRPGLDPGMWLLDPPRDWWRVVKQGRITGASVSVTPEHAARINDHVNTHLTRRRFAEGIETATQPVVVEKIKAKDGLVALDGRWLLTGAAGTRLRNTHVWSVGGKRNADAEMAEFMAETRHRDPYPPAVWPRSINGMDMVLDGRNGFAFYHFLTETLGNLAYAIRPDFTGKVRIQVGGNRKPSDFLMRWIEALYPSLKDRVKITRNAVKVGRAITVLNGRHLHAQSGNHTMASMGALGPKTHYWKGRDADRMSLSVLAMNGYEEGLRRLRETGLRQIAGGDWSHLPRRFWLGRKAERARDMGGEAELVEALRARGFAEVFFEDLSPLEQIAIMNRAEVMIGYHGAGYANMVFAGRNTHVIELGTLQTCLYRWQDFMPHANVSGCRYTSLYADLNVDGAREAVVMRSSPLESVALEEAGRDKVLDFIDAICQCPRTITDVDWLRTMSDLLLKAEDIDALRGLLSINRKAALTDPDLTIQLANLAVEDSDEQSAIGLLEKAWLATGDRPFLLERLILLSAQAGVGSTWDAEHARLYPQRADRLARRLGRMKEG